MPLSKSAGAPRGNIGQAINAWRGRNSATAGNARAPASARQAGAARRSVARSLAPSRGPPLPPRAGIRRSRPSVALSSARRASCCGSGMGIVIRALGVA